VGPSEAREDLLYEAFEAAFPGRRTLQGGLSIGTFRDLLLGLEYWERTFGAESVPRTIVLGITTRWVADIPRGESPLSSTITRYSSGYRVSSGPDGLTLASKSKLESAVSFMRYVDKQPLRYRATVCTMFQRALGGGGSVTGSLQGGADDTPRLLRRVLGFLEECRSPYKFHHLTPMKVEGTEKWMSNPGSFWYQTHHWNPDDDSAMVRRSFGRLRDTVERLGIDIFVVNLPEHPSNRAAFDPKLYGRYERLVAEGTEEWPLLDLRTLLPLADFYDAGHATARGAIRTTDETIRFMRRELAARTEANAGFAAGRAAGKQDEPPRGGS
jgi:hypothetical protein